MPFILRGVTLYGINSVFVDNATRAQAWELIGRHVDGAQLARMETVIGLASAIEVAPHVLEGKVRGRTVVDVNR
jgi:acrylyl-CoA reductase (NADPH)